MYGEGTGVPHNFKKALTWLLIPSMNGNKNALSLKKNYEGKLTPLRIKEASRIAAEWVQRQRNKAE